MSKVLYIGHLHEGSSGWCRAATDYIRALSTVTDVVARSVYLSKDEDPEPDIQEKLEKGTDGVTHIIQHLLPHHLDYNGRYKNIAISILESRNIQHTSWASSLNLMDEIWCPYTCALEETALTPPKKLVPHACNIDKYYNLYPKYELPVAFNFYTISDFVQRKNLKALIRAFHTEFSVNEPVNLVIKTNKFGANPQQVLDGAKESFKVIKEGLKLYPSSDYYKPEVLITHHLSEEQLMSLHQSCQCYVNTSYGEVWNYGLFDAMGFGNSCITPAQSDMDNDFGLGGPGDYLVRYKNAYSVNSYEEPCFATLDTFKDIQTSRESWDSIDIIDLQYRMREVYEYHKNERESGIEQVKKYSYENVGKIMGELL